MTASRSSAMGLSGPAEEIWDRLRTGFVVEDGFWLAFLFGANSTEIAELLGRTADLARAQVRRVEQIRLTGQDGVGRALEALLTPSPTVAATWVTDDPQLPEPERREVWRLFLRRVNERRDAVRSARPAALVLAVPADCLPLAREEAPDLWSYRSLSATFERAAGSALDPGEAEVARAEPRSIRPVTGEAIRPSPAAAPWLRQMAGSLRTGALEAAVAAARHALEASAGEDDRVLVNAWLAQVRDAQGQATEARRLARAALAAGRPLELDTTLALLRILRDSPDLDVARDAAAAAVELRREMASRYPDSPPTLRDLSVSLDDLARVQERLGGLGEAQRGFVESLALRRRLAAEYGQTPESLGDLSVSLDNVARVQEQLGAVTEARDSYIEALRWCRLLAERCPEFVDGDLLHRLEAKASQNGPGEPDQPAEPVER